MKKTLKKGFTIVELVIVIAVIAILAAVLIPTFSNVVKKAQTANDTQLIRNLNTVLAMDSADGTKHNTMHQALVAAKEAGYDIDKINATNISNEILWDCKNDVFCYLEGNDVKYIPETTLTNNDVEDVDFWRISSKDDDLTGKYSVYYTGSSTEITTTVGFDAGLKQCITSITYINNSETKQSVIINTNSAAATLTVYAPLDDVTHYGVLGIAYIRAVANESYHENGTVAFMEANNGHIFIEESGNVNTIYSNKSSYEVNEGVISKNDSNIEEISQTPLKVKVTNNGTVTNAYADNDTKANETTEASEFINFTAKTKDEIAVSKNAAVNKAIDDNGQAIRLDTDLQAAVEKGGYYVLFGDITITKRTAPWEKAGDAVVGGTLAPHIFTINSDFTLDLAGKTISADESEDLGIFKYPTTINGSTAEGQNIYRSIFKISKGGSFTLKDTSNDKNGKIKLDYTYKLDEYDYDHSNIQTAVYIESGASFIMDGGKINYSCYLFFVRGNILINGGLFNEAPFDNIEYNYENNLADGKEFVKNADGTWEVK